MISNIDLLSYQSIEINMNRNVIRMGKSVGSVIPKGIIEHFGLEVGDKLDFRIVGEYIKAIPVHPSAKTDAQATQHPGVSKGGGIE